MNNTYREEIEYNLVRKYTQANRVKTKRKFYDYEAKYNPKAQTEHIIPINIENKYTEVTSIALKAHKLLRCRGVTRSDFRFYNNRFYCLKQIHNQDDFIVVCLKLQNIITLLSKI